MSPPLPILWLLLAAPGAAEEVMHPAFPLVDREGRDTGDASAMDANRTCGRCHDTAFIVAHSAHHARGLDVDCLRCHVPGGLAGLEESRGEDGWVRLPMAAPASTGCGSCHGVVHPGPSPVVLPADFEVAGAPSASSRTLATGELFSPQRISDSFINLAERDRRDRPWDVHAARGLECVSCHFAANNPARAGLDGGKDGGMDGDNLRRDPRTLSTGEFLRRPDHRLGGAACAACHDAAAAHPDLPFRERHLEVLACEACHVTDLAAPAARAVDATVLTPAGGPRLEIRGVEDPTGDPDTWFSTGYRPFLLHEAGDGDGRFAPYNVLARWEWVDGTGEPVPPELLARAWKTTAGDYHPELVQLLDRDRDGLLAVEELLLDTPERAAAVAGRLAALGVREPRIRGLLEAHPLHHGVAGGPWAEGRCRSCHGHDSRLAEDIPLSETLPGGMAPVPAAGVAELLGGRELVRQGDGLVIRGSALAEDHYVPGLSRSWTGTAGFLFFALTLLGVTLHALMRILAARRRGSAPVIHGLRREYLYNAYERLWHWVMAFSVLVLIATGLRIHLPAAAAPLSFEAAVFVHNMVAVVLLLNAFLALFYHLATSEIRQFIPEGAGFAARLRAQARYYLHGIFRGASHPPGRSRQRKLNPLQQVTYAVLLNVLFPLQAVTGVLLWVAGVRPDLLRPLGGLSLLLPLHHLGSWLFLSFLVAHVYLTTTGHTPLAHVRAMISGWDDVDAGAAGAAGGAEP